MMRLRFPPAARHRGDLDRFREATRVLLFGSGIYAEPTLYALRQQGIEPVAICDNARAKQGGTHLGLPVIAPEQADLAQPGTVVVICSAVKYLEEIQAQCRRLGAEARPCVALFEDFPYDPKAFSFDPLVLHLDLDRYLFEFFAHTEPQTVLVQTLDVMITERCSLRCKDCSNLMQYYRNPEDLDFDRLFRALDRLMGSIDHLLEFRVLGGETFMNKQAHRYLERLGDYANASRIVVYSNGTILPRPEVLQWLRREDALVRITDYGEVSRRVTEMTGVLEHEGIAYVAEPCTQWQDCSGFRLPITDPELLADQFGRCEAARFVTVLKDRLYQCPFSANATNLSAIPDEAGNYLPLDGTWSDEQIRAGLKAMLRGCQPSPACAYCVGRHMAPTIPSAIQIDAPRPFEPHP